MYMMYMKKNIIVAIVYIIDKLILFIIFTDNKIYLFRWTLSIIIRFLKEL